MTFHKKLIISFLISSFSILSTNELEINPSYSGLHPKHKLEVKDTSPLEVQNLMYLERSALHGKFLPFSDREIQHLMNPKRPLSSNFKTIKLLGRGCGSEKVLLLENKKKSSNQKKQRFALKVGLSFSHIQNSRQNVSDSEIDPEEFMQFYFEESGASKMAISEFEKGLKLNHPMIVKVYALLLKTSKNEVTTSILMEYVNGPVLMKVKNHSLSNNFVLQGLMNIFDALLYTIDQGLLPTDLHSENIIVAEDGFHLIDLGGYEYIEHLINNDADHEDEDEDEDEDETLENIIKEIRYMILNICSKGSFSPLEITWLEEETQKFIKDNEEDIKQRIEEKNIEVLKNFIHFSKSLVQELKSA